jgi:2-aminoethylphosphonate-pyruvate transaminase
MTAKDPILLTPGPLTTTLQTKEAQLRDYGSRDIAFIEMTAGLVTQLNDIVHGGEDHACVLMQGSGTFSVEAALGTLVPKSGHILVCINGEYGKRIAKICEIIGRRLPPGWSTRRSPPIRRSHLSRSCIAKPARAS